MDVSVYLPMFLAEGREHLQNLNLALVRVEIDPRERETTNEIFRIAHSLKGMSATMGFARMAALTHEMENVLELLRSGEDGLPRPALDVLFACLDQLEQMTSEIETGGTESSDPAALVERLRTLVVSGEVAQVSEAVPLVAAAGPASETVEQVTGHGLALLRISFSVAASADMPSVRLFLAVRALEELGDIVHATPEVEAIERGEIAAGAPVEIWIGTAGEIDTVVAALAALEGLSGVIVAPHDGAAQVAAAPTPIKSVVAEPEPLADAASDEPVAGSGGRAPAAGPKHQTVRVDAERLDPLMHLMGEMVVQRTRLETLAKASGDSDLQSAVGDLSRVAQNLQSMVMQVRMVPVESVFMRFPRMVRDLAMTLGKQVDLKIAARTPSSIARSSRHSATRSCTSCAMRSTMVSSRRTSGSPPASRRRARSRSRPHTRAGTCSSPCATTGAGWTQGAWVRLPCEPA